MMVTLDTNIEANSCGTSLLMLKPDTVLFEAGDRGGLWRVQSGMLRLDRPSSDGPILAMLALAGDWLGVDTLCGQPHPWRATAVTAVTLRRCEPVDDAQRQQWIIEALLQQPERCHDLARLRTGPVAARLTALLRLLGAWPRPALGAVASMDTSALPPLRVMANLIDAKTETVCRVLGRLLPGRGRPKGLLVPPHEWSLRTA